ncbi:uncharacterized protein LOC111701172 [Eurytemora carolleeae]|uniref:uncharacterized protein LOC111701172 n=1 Tax=Eurytemora carolleeae TaxID=1294199 RepID=UPI000C75D750|nr:uncharacterized protein LOC111701172 [Eurytemora carolleeae]|eukprot:XP_023328108.1 uncharacterized protein LOC111701172 [Eurytemora affinis]
MYSFFIVAVVHTIIVGLGIAVNLRSLVCLLQPVINKTYTLLLRCLATVDSLVLAFFFLCFCLPFISRDFAMEVHNQYLHILLAINSTCLGVTMYLLVCLSIEKYYNQRTVATVYKRSLLIYLGFAVGFTVCFNFPKFLELNSKQFWEADE